MRSSLTVLGLALLTIVAAGCSDVVPLVELPALKAGDPTFAATLVGYAGNPVVSGNRVDILLNGDQIFPAKLAAVRGARKTINYAQYVYEEGKAAAELASALADKCRAGLKVNILLDGFGTLLMPAEYAETMRAAGCNVAIYRPLHSLSLDRANYRNHRRILVVDGRVGITGGSGMSGKWNGNGRLEGHWRDTDVRVEGPVVEQLQGAFAENWLEATGVAIGGAEYFPRPVATPGPVDAQVIRSSPAGGSFAMYTTFLLAMSSARRSLYITNPYFLPEEKMLETLTGAAGKGARVVVLVPGVIDHNIVRRASRTEFGRLLKAGVEIYEYQAAMLHAKTMIVDGVWATVGSTNLDRRSFALNEELNLVMYNAEMARRLEQSFQEDLTFSKRVTYEEWRRRGVVTRVLEFLALPLRDQL